MKELYIGEHKELTVGDRLIHDCLKFAIGNTGLSYVDKPDRLALLRQIVDLDCLQSGDVFALDKPKLSLCCDAEITTLSYTPYCSKCLKDQPVISITNE